jgi:RNA polymerase sigma-70 factor, ECF subfamily
VSSIVDPSELIEKVRSGDRAAFAALYDVLAAQVFGVVKRVLRDPAMSEEVTQEVFVEIWSTAPRFDPQRATVTGWATMIARRRAIDRVRSEQSRRNRAEALARESADEVERPDDVAARNDEAGHLRAALRQLPVEQRMVLELAFLEGETHHDIAERLAIPLGTVKGRVRLGLKRLRGHLEAAT